MQASPTNIPKLSTAKKIVSWLFRDSNLSLHVEEWGKLFFATLIKNNPQFSKEFFDALCQKITTSFADSNLSDIKKDMIIHNALCYLAFSDPQAGNTLFIRGTQYTIQKIQLTSGWLSAPYYAYGLKATLDPNAQSYLIFQGTTTPADNGFLVGVMADSIPGGAIGKQLYERGKKQIQHFINAEHQKTQKTVLCIGQSLGGAMSLHAHIHQPDKVDFVAINPPSLTSRERGIYEHQTNEVRQPNTRRTLHVISHQADNVWNLGSIYFPEGTTVYRHGKADENKILAHAKAPDCSPQHPDPIFEKYEYHGPIRNKPWKILKPFLFFLVIFLHTISWPMRVLIKMRQLIALKLNSRDTESSIQTSNEVQPAENGNNPVAKRQRLFSQPLTHKKSPEQKPSNTVSSSLKISEDEYHYPGLKN